AGSSKLQHDAYDDGRGSNTEGEVTEGGDVNGEACMCARAVMLADVLKSKEDDLRVAAELGLDLLNKYQASEKLAETWKQQYLAMKSRCESLTETLQHQTELNEELTAERDGLNQRLSLLQKQAKDSDLRIISLQSTLDTQECTFSSKQSALSTQLSKCRQREEKLVAQIDGLQVMIKGLKEREREVWRQVWELKRDGRERVHHRRADEEKLDEGAMADTHNADGASGRCGVCGYPGSTGAGVSDATTASNSEELPAHSLPASSSSSSSSLNADSASLLALIDELTEANHQLKEDLAESRNEVAELSAQISGVVVDENVGHVDSLEYSSAATSHLDNTLIPLQPSDEASIEEDHHRPEAVSLSRKKLSSRSSPSLFPPTSSNIGTGTGSSQPTVAIQSRQRSSTMPPLEMNHYPHTKPLMPMTPQGSPFGTAIPPFSDATRTSPPRNSLFGELETYVLSTSVQNLVASGRLSVVDNLARASKERMTKAGPEADGEHALDAGTDSEVTYRKSKTVGVETESESDAGGTGTTTSPIFALSMSEGETDSKDGVQGAGKYEGTDREVGRRDRKRSRVLGREDGIRKVEGGDKSVAAVNSGGEATSSSSQQIPIMASLKIKPSEPETPPPRRRLRRRNSMDTTSSASSSPPSSATTTSFLLSTSTPPRNIRQRSADQSPQQTYPEGQQLKLARNALSHIRSLCVMTRSINNRLQSTDTRSLNRRLRRAFDINELTALSNELIENVMVDVESLGERFPTASAGGVVKGKPIAGPGGGERLGAVNRSSPSTPSPSSQRRLMRTANGTPSTDRGTRSSMNSLSPLSSSAPPDNEDPIGNVVLPMVGLVQSLLKDIGKLRVTLNAYALT
ncbi:hypothetical protein HK102_013423, partial [Quaeritorhiza haematococci]